MEKNSTVLSTCIDEAQQELHLKLCWTGTAKRIFGEKGPFPAVSRHFSCGAWGLKKANSVGWFALVYGELAFFVATSTEQPLWRPSRITAQREINSERHFNSNWRLVMMVCGSVIYTAALVYTPVLNDAMDVLPLSMTQLALALAGVPVIVVGIEISKNRYRSFLEQAHIVQRERTGLDVYWGNGPAVTYKRNSEEVEMTSTMAGIGHEV